MNSKYIILALTLILLFACKKEEQGTPTDVFPDLTPAPTNHTTFVFSGVMNVDKYDSSWVPITNYNVNFVESRMIKNPSNFQLTTQFNGASVKGETINSVNFDVSNNTFSTFNSGTGIFIYGVLEGFYNKDSLYYKVIYKTPDSNNVYLRYQGRFTNSF